SKRLMSSSSALAGPFSGTSPLRVTSPASHTPPGSDMPLRESACGTGMSFAPLGSDSVASPAADRVAPARTMTTTSAKTTPNLLVRVARSIRDGLHRSSIATRMVLVVVALVGGTAGAIGALSYSRASRALEEAAKTRLALLARDISEHLHGELEDRAA